MAIVAERLSRTVKGQEEIGAAKKSLPAKLRTVLFLVEPDKEITEIQRRVVLIGAPTDALQQLVNGGYVASVGSFNAPVVEGVTSVGDQIAAFRVAKAFMNDTVVDALGIRAFMYTLKLERCATGADLATILPDYGQALLKKLDREAARALVERARELIAAATGK